MADKDPVLADEMNLFFSSIPLSELPAPTLGEVVVIDGRATLKDTVAQMQAKNISSAPVTNPDAPADAGWMDKYCGIVDMVGIAFALLSAEKQSKQHLSSLSEHAAFTSTTAAEVATTASMGPFVPLDPECTMLDAMLIMGKYQLHRIPIVQRPGGDIRNFLTQSAVIEAIASRSEHFKKLTSKSLAELGLATPQKVISVTINDTLHDAIRLIREFSLSAVPVLGVQGEIVGNVSARDLRNLVLDPALFRLVSKPVRQFLAANSIGEHEHMNPAITCRAKDTLHHIIQELAATRIHRIYLCDSHNKPVRVISLSDILNVFVKEPSPDYFDQFVLAK